MSSTIIPNLTHLKIPLEDVVKATNNFHRDNIIGHGDFGKVYKGQLLQSGNVINIAARRLDRRHGLGDVEFWNEVSVLSDLKHKNLVSLIGFCDENYEKIIITTYEAKGSLGQFLDNMNLTWTQRLRMSIGVAKALSYLHYDEGRGYAVIHCFINTSTILLDENSEAKLSGFEFSIKQLVNRRDHITLCELVGAIGYMDPAIVKTGGVTHKSDTYSFGVVLFEILCGKKAFIQNDDDMLLAPLVIHHYKNNTLKDVIHPDLFNQMSPKSLNKYLKVAYACLTEERARRPDTNDIVGELEKALEFHMQLENLRKNWEKLRIPSSDIKLATNNFSKSYGIGSWGGCTLYKVEFDQFNKENPSLVEGQINGEHSKGHNIVVIKRYPYDDDMYGEKEFLTEIEILSRVKHRNIITLVGFCVDGSDMILVTENASKGYLHKYLSNMMLYKHNFTWEKRLRICVDVAHALCYLHYEMEDQNMIINRDICSHNIALDENWGAKIFYFGFSVFLPPNQEDEALYLKWIGRPSYTDPEYKKTNKLKRESDVYSFGVVLFEILCGKVANDPIYLKESGTRLADVARRSFHMGTLEDMIDPRIKDETIDGGANRDSLRTFIEIAHQCVAETQDGRPTMKVVVEKLEKALFFQEEKTHRSNTDQVANKHEKLHFTHGILGNNSELLMIPLSDVKLATNNFSETCKIASWGHCTLYRAKLDHFERKNPSCVDGKNNVEHPKGHSTVVIKRYPFDDYMYGEKEFLTEIKILSRVKHRNIITLLGFCVDDSEMILVIENASKGYLRKYLNNMKLYKHIFTWEKRLKICIGVAHALCYLHYEMEDQKTIINRDIWSKNIALDGNWGAKIFHFGFSVFLPPNQEDEALYLNWIGRPPYIDPEYKRTGRLKRESDVYSFGVILLEILCGKVANDPIYWKESGIGLPDVARKSFHKGTLEDMIDPIIKDQTIDGRANKDSLRTFIEIAHQCVATTQHERPTMKIVVKELEKALSFQEEKIHRSNMDQVANKHVKLYLTRGIPEMDLERLKVWLSDIELATNDFSKTHKITSWKDYTLYTAELKYFKKEYQSSVEGNKGEHRVGHNSVIIKRYPEGHDVYGKEHFYREIEMLISVKHSNIATLLGFCVEGSEMILVINGVSNGYLSKYLENVNLMCDLTWEKRLKICVDVANALKYLHSEIEDGKMILNNLISRYNIGLDENWGAKIIDFADFVSLPSNLDQDHNLINRTSRFDLKLNVRCFGEILFEILCGRGNDPVYYKRKMDTWLGSVERPDLCWGTLQGLVDPIIMDETDDSRFYLDKGPNMDSLNTFIKITARCLAEPRYLRPTMEVVVNQLEEALSFQKKRKGDHRISLEDISLATNNFHDNNCIGGGGFGRAYKGELQDGDRFKTIVAKRLDKKLGQGERQFLSELQILWGYKHENIVGLEGYCNENHEKIIVYEYASRGSLDRYLIDASLTWVKRLNICIDVASALDFLHGGVGKQAKVIHRDIKAQNILLNDDWKAKLADFGLSLISSLTQEGDYIIDHWCGTPGYVDPVYKNSKVLTIESDIYSFGVVLFEISCGRSTYQIHKHEGHHLPEFIKKRFDEGKQYEVVFEKIREQIVPESLTTFQKIAYQCLHHEREKRPATNEVLTELKKALELQLNSNSEVKCDHASITETQVDRHFDELNGMTTPGESENSKIHNKEKMLPADQTNDSSAESGCCTCWPCGFRKVKTLRNKCTNVKRI